MQEDEEEVRFQIGDVMLAGTLTMPERALGIVLFAHGSGSSRHSPRNRFVAAMLRKAGLGTLLFDLLTGDEEAEDLVTGCLRFDIRFLAGRLLGATDWIAQNPATERLRVGYFGSSTGGAAALMASVERREKIRAIVCRGSRTDMAKAVLARVAAPTLLIVGQRDEMVLAWNCESLAELRCEKQLEIIPAATHLFEESGTLEEVARLAAEWFRRWLAPGGPLISQDIDGKIGKADSY
jgi:putative phosphoribosyl transferase